MLHFRLLLIIMILTPSFVCAGSVNEQVASRDKAATEFYHQYLSRLANENISVFYSECSLQEGGKAGIIIPIGKAQGLYTEITKYKTVINTANLTFKEGKWNTEVAQGGVYTISRVNNLIEEILGKSFYIISSDNLSNIIDSIPERTCVDKEP
jgi:hypothetical protein